MSQTASQLPYHRRYCGLVQKFIENTRAAQSSRLRIADLVLVWSFVLNTKYGEL